MSAEERSRYAADTHPINDEGQTRAPDGHRWRLDPSGFLYEWDGDTHGGPECLACGDMPCQWCETDWADQVCEVASQQPMMPIDPAGTEQEGRTE